MKDHAEGRPADRQCHPEDPGTNNRSAPAEEWNAALLRNLWPALNEQTMGRKLSVEHEEAWLTLAGFLLRPGFGFAHDGLRMDELWQLRDAGLCFPGKRSKVQEYILWRRVAGGLTAERQERLLAGELASSESSEATPVEILASSLLTPSSENAQPEAERDWTRPHKRLSLPRSLSSKLWGKSPSR